MHLTARLPFFFSSIACAAIVACTSSDVPIGVRDDAGAGADAATTVADGGGGPPTPVDASPTGDSSTPKNTSTGTVELDVVSVRAGMMPLPGILVVAWAQLNDDGPDPAPLVAYSTPFTGQEKHVSIPLSAVKMPNPENLLCVRACTDEAICPCNGTDPPIGLAYIVVVHDANSNGVPELPYYSSGGDPDFGIARTVLAWTEQAHSPFPAPFTALFPNGSLAGINAYELVRPDGGSFDRLGIPAPGTVFQLLVCDTLDRTQCDAKGPNLS